MTTQAQRLHLAERKAKKPSLYDELMGKDLFFRTLSEEEQQEVLKEEEARRKAEAEERLRKAKENTRRLYEQLQEKKREAYYRTPEGQAELKRLREETERKRIEEAERDAKPSPYDDLPKRVIEGHTYRFDADTNRLYDYDTQMGELSLYHVGWYQPGNEDEPIRYIDKDNYGRDLLDH